MKKLTIILLFTAIALKALSQAVVTDPGLTELAIEEAIERKTIIAKSIETLSESVEQTKKLEKTYELAKEGYDALVEINELLSKIEMIQRTIERQEKLIKKTQKMVNDFGRDDIFSVKEYRRIANNLVRIIENCSEIIEMFDLIIQPGQTKMNDAERLSLIMEIEEKYNDKHAVAMSNLKYYETVHEQRQAVRALNNIATKMYE